MFAPKTIHRRTAGVLPVLKARFPSLDEEVLISVASAHNNSLIRSTEALSEIVGISFDDAVRQGCNRRKNKRKNAKKNSSSSSPRVKRDKRGVPWSPVPVETVINVETKSKEEEKEEIVVNNEILKYDALDEDDFQKWLAQLEQIEKEIKINANDIPNVTEVYNIESSSPISTTSQEIVPEETGDCPVSLEEGDVVPEVLSESLNTMVFNCGPDDEGSNSILLESELEGEIMPEQENEFSKWEEADYVQPFFSKLSMSLPTVPDTCLVQCLSNYSDSVNNSVCSEEEETDLVVKLILSTKTIYRFRVRRENYNFEELKKVAAEKCIEEKGREEESVNGFRLKYVDDEGDWITVVTQEEWEEATRNFGSLIKLHVC